MGEKDDQKQGDGLSPRDDSFDRLMRTFDARELRAEQRHQEVMEAIRLLIAQCQKPKQEEQRSDTRVWVN